MAIRYCGKVTIRMRWDDARNAWRCVVSSLARRGQVVWVSPPPAERQTVDSPGAYDRAAHAALSFAYDRAPCPSRTRNTTATEGVGRLLGVRKHMYYRDYAPTQYDTKGLALPDRQDWLVVPHGLNRDSPLWQESNWHAALALLGGESETLEVHRFNHWACGWFEVMLLHPSREADLALVDVDDYPLLDEDDLSDRQWQAYTECFNARDMVRELRRVHGLSDRAEELLTALAVGTLMRIHETHIPSGNTSITTRVTRNTPTRPSVSPVTNWPT